MTLHTRQSGAWAKVNGLFIRQSGVWTPVKNAYVRDGGVWKVYYSSEIVVEVTTNRTGLILSTLFRSTDWASDTPKRVVIQSGVTIGGASWGALASKPSGITTNEWGGILTLDNYGTIQGIGGTANSGVGGSALYRDTVAWSKTVIVNNFGTIRAGGGGGGRGGSGSFTSSGWTAYRGDDQHYISIHSGFGRTSYALIWESARYDALHNNPGGSTMTMAQASSLYGGGVQTLGGVQYQGGPLYQEVDDGYVYIGYKQLRANVTTTTPTTGGAGGRGLGSDGAASAGSAGGTNAGTGGTGGGWGATGSTGAAGNAGAGVAGGVAGIAYTAAKWTMTNTGTIQGRVV